MNHRAPLRFSFIVPFHRGIATLERCLHALDVRPAGSDLVVVSDEADEDCAPLAAIHGARVLRTARRSGPAVARNLGARVTAGDVLVFVDADVVISAAGLARLVATLVEQATTAAVFGSYDDAPGDPGFMSQYKNLSHAFVHRSSAARARTFWTGFGAVRRDAFEAVGGFDERMPSVEDIDLGYRLTEAGYSIVLDPALAACHLKRWTVLSTIKSDVFDRGIPWTQLVLRYGAMADDLNLRTTYRWSVVLAYAALVLAGLAFYDWRFLGGAAAVLAVLTSIHLRYYAFFYRRRGAAFAVRAWLVHLLHHVYNGISFGTGVMLYGATRYLRVRLPGSIPADPWMGRPL